MIEDEPRDAGRPFGDLRNEGLLWLINATVFHPRGYALTLHFERDDPEDLGACTGWSILGDGNEQWQFGCDDETQARVAEAFTKIRALLP